MWSRMAPVCGPSNDESLCRFRAPELKKKLKEVLAASTSARVVSGVF